MLKRALLIAIGAIVGACKAAPAADVETTEPETRAAAEAVQAQCHSDEDCNGGVEGTGVVCSNAGDTAGTCIFGCHSNCDCSGGQTCVHASPHWRCETIY